MFGSTVVLLKSSSFWKDMRYHIYVLVQLSC